MARYIYSTATAAQKFPIWAKSNNDLPKMTGHVTIAGGANLANKHFITPAGVVTKVTDEQFAILENDPAFQRRVDRGFFKVEKKEIEIEKVTSGMEGRDESAPLTDGDFEANGEKPPISTDPDAPAAQQNVSAKTSKKRTRNTG